MKAVSLGDSYTLIHESMRWCSGRAQDDRVVGDKASRINHHEPGDTALRSHAALLAFHITDREETLLFAMAVRHGATDSQIGTSAKAPLTFLILTIFKLANSLRRKGTKTRAIALLSRRQRRNARFSCPAVATSARR